jgi:nitroimidazol reductase NimA-like FMN-containing flavoprotein (pyridoxamine 5'-phosphate oxidase superfamily)
MAVYPVDLSDEECLARLRSHPVGRIAFCSEAGPQIYPVNYALSDDAIVFRTSPYGPMAGQSHHGDVAFEVDELDRELHEGWSVLVVGPAETLEADETLEMTSLRLLEPWAAGSRSLFVRITPHQLSGRQFGSHR